MTRGPCHRRSPRCRPASIAIRVRDVALPRRVAPRFGWPQILARRTDARREFYRLLAPARSRRLYTSSVFFRGETVGKYKILSPLGSGGFGTVYLAEDTWIHKKVAIKVPHRQNVVFND